MVFWVRLGSSGAILASLDLFRLIWAHLDSLELIMAHLSSFRFIQALLNLFKLIWALLHPFRLIYAHLGWLILDSVELISVIEPYLGSFELN